MGWGYIRQKAVPLKVKGRMKIKVNTVEKKDIHKVSSSNLIIIRKGRQDWAKKRFNNSIRDAKEITIIFHYMDGTRSLYSTLEDDELVYTLESAKLNIFRPLNKCP